MGSQCCGKAVDELVDANAIRADLHAEIILEPDHLLMDPEERRLEQAAIVLQRAARALFAERDHITGSKVREVMLDPGRGGRASNLMHSSVTGGVLPLPHPATVDYRPWLDRREDSRDEHRRVLETNVAQALFADGPDYAAAVDRMRATFDGLMSFAEANGGDRELLAALQGKMRMGVYQDSYQASQFANGIQQAMAERNVLAVLATQCAGLLQVVAWLAGDKPGAFSPEALEQSDKCGFIYAEHPFYGAGRGRMRNPDEGMRLRTELGGIIKSERHVALDDGHRTVEMTKAHTAQVPSHDLPEKPVEDESHVPTWLKEPTARKMPFVNSVSGLGLLASISDAQGMLPADPAEKREFYRLIAAAQLNYVGGHSFFEFLKGAEIGQDALTTGDDLDTFMDKTTRGEVVGGLHGISFESCLEEVPDEVYLHSAERMRHDRDGVI